MQPSFRPTYPPPLLRTAFSVELAPPLPESGSCSLRRTFSSEKTTTDVPTANASPVVEMAGGSIPKNPPKLDTRNTQAPAFLALKRRSSRTHVQAPAVHFSIPKPEGEQGRMTTNGPNGKKGYILNEVSTDPSSPHYLKWTPEEFKEAQVRS